MLVYKIDVMSKLKEKGYNTNKIRKEKLLSESALQDIRQGKVCGVISINNLCSMLGLQPGSIIGWVPDDQ